MAIFLGVCIELIPHVSEHDPMEVSFSAAAQGDQISQVDFSRNLWMYFYALLYLNAEGLRHDSMCNLRGSYLPNQFEEIDLKIV